MGIRLGEFKRRVHVGHAHVGRPDAALGRDAVLLALAAVWVLAIALDLALLAWEASVYFAALGRRRLVLRVRGRYTVALRRQYVRGERIDCMVVRRVVSHSKRLCLHRNRMSLQRLNAFAAHV